MRQRRRKSAALIIAAGAIMIGQKAKSPSTQPTYKQVGDFRAAIRSAVRGLWRGFLDIPDFLNMMYDAQRTYLTRAWHEGAAQCGVQPDELSNEEQLALQNLIFNERTYLGGFATDIVENSRENGGKLTPHLQRAEMWANKYREAKAQGTLMACADSKYEWFLGSTSEHCQDCLGYAGRVHRASVWAAVGAEPQSRALACHGYHCACELKPTDKPALPGRPPRPSGG